MDEEEIKHWHDVCRTFLLYSDFVGRDLSRTQRHLNRLSERHAALLPSQTFDKIQAIADAAENNQDFFEAMVSFHLQHDFTAPSSSSSSSSASTDPSKAGKLPDPYDGDPIPNSQQHRNQAVLHSLYREWSKEGIHERETCFLPLIEELERLLPVTEANAFTLRVLVPGCGLARLPLEIAARGYCSQGNEFSAFMAMPSQFMLNGIDQSNAFIVHPWLDKVCNIIGTFDNVRGVAVPDIAAIEILENGKYYHLPERGGGNNDQSAQSGEIQVAANESLPPPPHTQPNSQLQGKQPPSEFEHQFMSTDDTSFSPFPRFSMSAGDFLELYHGPQHEGKWNALVTCFFIDTAPVIIEYIEHIFRLLPPGGVWINQGPLLYHWVTDNDGNNDERYNQSVELSYEEVKHVIQAVGFEFIKEEFRDCTYCNYSPSLMWTSYKTVFFSVRKPLTLCLSCK